MNKKKGLSERLGNLTYMQVSLTLFGFAAVLLILSLVLALVTGGEVGWIAATAGLAAFLLSLIGLIITLYGHFAVGMEGKISWKVGLFTNGAVVLITLALYIVGLVV